MTMQLSPDSVQLVEEVHGGYLSALDITADQNVTERTVRKWMKDERLPTVKLANRCVLVPPARIRGVRKQRRMTSRPAEPDTRKRPGWNRAAANHPPTP